MAPRHHTSGRYAAKGRQPRTEIKGRKPAMKSSGANALYNEQARRKNAAGAVVTAGQLVASGAKLN